MRVAVQVLHVMSCVYHPISGNNPAIKRQGAPADTLCVLGSLPLGLRGQLGSGSGD